MTSIPCHVETIQYRVGKMPDSALRESDISNKTRDIFCNRNYGFVSDPDEFIASIQTYRSNEQDQVIPLIRFHPAMEKYGTPRGNLKIIAHECGHDIRQIEQGIFNVLNLGRRSLDYCTFGLFFSVMYEVADSIHTNLIDKKIISRQEALKKLRRASLTSAILGSIGVGSAQTGSYIEEKSADFLSDVLVPEVTMREALGGILNAYKENIKDPIIQKAMIRKPSLYTLLLNNHPDNEDRYSSSEKNCKRFAKNTAFWS